MIQSQSPALQSDQEPDDQIASQIMVCLHTIELGGISFRFPPVSKYRSSQAVSIAVQALSIAVQAVSIAAKAVSIRAQAVSIGVQAVGTGGQAVGTGGQAVSIGGFHIITHWQVSATS